MDLSCTGRLDSEVTVLMQLNMTVNASKNITVLNFKRRKMCYKSKAFLLFIFKRLLQFSKLFINLSKLESFSSLPHNLHYSTEKASEEVLHQSKVQQFS